MWRLLFHCGAPPNGWRLSGIRANHVLVATGCLGADGHSKRVLGDAGTAPSA
jgi:hypothetical protein